MSRLHPATTYTNLPVSGYRFRGKFSILVLIAIILGVLSLGGCNSQPVTSSIDHHSTEKPDSAPAETFAPLDGQTVFSVLAAEMALAQENYEMALSFYLSLAQHKQDVGAAKRVVAIAQIIGAHEELLEAAQIWSATDPENPLSYLAQTQGLIKLGRYDELSDPIAAILSRDPDFPLERIFLTNQTHSPEESETITDLLVTLILQYPENGGLHLALASILYQEGLLESAATSVRQGLNLTASIEGFSLAAQIDEEMGHPDDATNWIKKGLKVFPQDRRLTALFTRLNSRLDQPEKSLPVLEQYYRINLDDYPMVSMYARVALESNKLPTARRLYETLLSSQSTKDEANYFLGIIARDEDRIEAAIEHFRQIRPSNFFPSAIANLVDIHVSEFDQQTAIEEMNLYIGMYPEESEPYRQLAHIHYEQEEYQQAIEILNQALEKLPDHLDLLYSRALALDLLGQHTNAIADLRKVIEKDPENTMALNALGYTLADNQIDLNEAWILIQKAYSMQPNDPAIIDSLGWIHYRRGELEKAETLLSNAFDMTKNHEIAAHLGEVLWKLDRQADAEIIWNQGLEDKPDSQIIINTRKRLKGM